MTTTLNKWNSFRAFALLHDAHGMPRFPIAYITNSGGFLESDRAAALSGLFGVAVHEDQIVQAHTPLKLGLAKELADEPVLLVGRGDLKRVGAGYGLRNCLTVDDLTLAAPASVPFASHVRRRAKEQQISGATSDRAAVEAITAGRPISAVVVLNDPEDWYCALQICLDVVLGRGWPGARVLPGTTTDHAPHVVFCNPDLEWAGAYPAPRLGCGAFASCLQTLHREVTGQPLPHVTWFGKPNAAPYDLALKALGEQAGRLGWWGDDNGDDRLNTQRHDSCTSIAPPSLKSMPLRSRFGAIFAVGDNPDADVAGANAAGAPWVSVLVRTGVFNGPGNSKRHPAAIVVDDVAAAVRAALHRSRAATWHSMR